MIAPRVNAREGIAAVARRKILPTGEGHFITRDSLSLWYTISGHGPALVVPTPGWGASSDMYMRSLVAIEGSFSLIYFDTRGAGRSEAPAEKSGYAFKFFVDDLEALRLHLQLSDWLIFAHSDASLQGMAYAIKYRKACRGLFIVDGTVNNDDEEYKRDLAARMRRISHEPWYAAAKKALDSKPKSDEEFKKSFLGDGLPMYFANYRAAVRARPYFLASTYHIKAFEYDEHTPKFGRKNLSLVRVPSAVFEGDSDVITTPLEASRLHRGIKNSTLFTITNAGHFPWLEQPDTFFECFARAARQILRR
jgi:proline iminopeptidase